MVRSDAIAIPLACPAFSEPAGRVAPHITGDGFDLFILFLFSFDVQIWIRCFFYRCVGPDVEDHRSRAFENPKNIKPHAAHISWLTHNASRSETLTLPSVALA